MLRDLAMEPSMDERNIVKACWMYQGRCRGFGLSGRRDRIQREMVMVCYQFDGEVFHGPQPLTPNGDVEEEL